MENKKQRTFKQLSEQEKHKIYNLYRKGTGKKVIAKILNKHISTIYRELHRQGDRTQRLKEKN